MKKPAKRSHPHYVCFSIDLVLAANLKASQRVVVMLTDPFGIARLIA